MQVTSLFATFFAFLTLIAPSIAMQIAVSASVTSGSNATITCTDASINDGPLTFFLQNNRTQDMIAQNATSIGNLTVTIPVNATGNGWTIRATSSNGTTVGVSPSFSILTPPTSDKKSMAGPVIGAVIASVVVFSLIVLGVFLYMRRRQQMFAAGPKFDIEVNYPPGNQLSRSFSSMSTALGDVNHKPSKSLEMEKYEWETQLEEQFARARAATPDVRGGTPVPRNLTPIPLVPQRAVTRNPSY